MRGRAERSARLSRGSAFAPSLSHVQARHAHGCRAARAAARRWLGGHPGRPTCSAPARRAADARARDPQAALAQPSLSRPRRAARSRASAAVGDPRERDPSQGILSILSLLASPPTKAGLSSDAAGLGSRLLLRPRELLKQESRRHRRTGDKPEVTSALVAGTVTIGLERRRSCDSTRTAPLWRDW